MESVNPYLENREKINTLSSKLTFISRDISEIARKNPNHSDNLFLIKDNYFNAIKNKISEYSTVCTHKYLNGTSALIGSVDCVTNSSDRIYYLCKICGEVKNFNKLVEHLLEDNNDYEIVQQEPIELDFDIETQIVKWDIYNFLNKNNK